MTAITATPNADKSVTLDVSGMPVLGSRVGTWGIVSGFGTQSGTTIADTAGDATYGSNVQASWTAGSLSYGSVSQGKAVTVGQYYAFRWLVRLNPARPDVPGDYVPPVEVWLDTTASKPWGDDRTSRRILVQRSTEDPDPYGYTELWLFLQASAATETIYLRWRPLYPSVTSSVLYFKFMQFYNGALDPKRTTPRIWRTDANGRRELALDFMPPPPPSTTLTTTPIGSSYGPVTDFEAALAGNVTYEVADVGGGDTAIDATTTITLGGTAATKPRLSRSSTGENVEVELVTAYSADRNGSTTLHRVVDRPSPIVLEGPVGTREGELEVWCQDYPAALSVVGILKSGEELVYRQATHPGMDLRFVPTRVSERPATDDGRRWLVSCAYVETGS